MTVTHRHRSRPGATFHEAALPADEITEHDGIRVTTVARTLLDFAAATTPVRLRRAVNVAESRRLADAPSLPALMTRYPHRRGIVNLRAVIADLRIGFDIPKSELEIAFLEFLDRFALPRPEVNAWLELGGRWYEVDCLWRDAALVIELDSRTHHSGAQAFETDRARDLALVSAGFRSGRVTWRRLHNEPERLGAEIRAALAEAHVSPLREGKCTARRDG